MGEHEKTFGGEQYADALIKKGEGDEGDMHEIPQHIVSKFVILNPAVGPKGKTGT